MASRAATISRKDVCDQLPSFSCVPFSALWPRGQVLGCSFLLFLLLMLLLLNVAVIVDVVVDYVIDIIDNVGIIGGFFCFSVSLASGPVGKC